MTGLLSVLCPSGIPDPEKQHRVYVREERRGQEKRGEERIGEERRGEERRGEQRREKERGRQEERKTVLGIDMRDSEKKEEKEEEEEETEEGGRENCPTLTSFCSAVSSGLKASHGCVCVFMCVCVCVCVCVCASHGPVDTQASHTPIPGTSTQSLTFPGLQHVDTHTVLTQQHNHSSL